ncbi:MAG TPA: DNA methyltransferase, partial [Verrucomicrobiae bacterium]
ARHVGELFSVMATGGDFLLEPIRHFNGSLFDAGAVLELTAKEIAAIGTAAGEDWSAVDVSISGTLFERGLNPAKRTQLGAHYTGRTDIETIVEPVVLAPLRREWADVRAQAGKLLNVESGSSRGDEAQTSKISESPHVVSYKNKTARKSRATAEKLVLAFLERLKTVRVLDPAGGSGNFLFVTLQKLLDLERDVNHFLREHGFTPQFPQVSPLQLHYIEIDPYAHDLAQTVVWIGYIQWLRANGYGYPAEPILKPMGANFHRADALFTDWPEVDFIVSNPPFLGDKLMRGKLGDEYVEKLRKLFEGRIPGQSDLCCYWFEKARELIEHGKCQRAGLLATQGIRGGANREVLKRIKETGDIFFAVSDREWILDGATVHVSMIGFDNGKETPRILNGKIVPFIHGNLSSAADTTKATQLAKNSGIAFIGTTKGGDFDIAENEALSILSSGGNPNGKPNSDVLKPILNGKDVLRRMPQRWLIDNAERPLDEACQYEQTHKLVVDRVKIERDKNRDKWLRENWWKLQRVRTEMRSALVNVSRFIALPRVAKHRVCVWFEWPVVTDDQTVVFARADDFFFGVVQSRIHEVWAYAQGTQVRERESGFRYRPTVCFETFPFPFADDLEEPPKNLEADLNAAKHYAHIVLCEEPVPYRTSSSRREEALTKKSEIKMSLVTSAATREQHRAAIAAAAQELNELRERWLNPPEWTVETILEFPASVDGPWSRYVDCGGKRSATPLSESSATQSAAAATALPAQSKIGLARYPRLVPKDADCAAKLKKRTLTNLYNERPTWLANAHKKLDAAVAAAYGFPADLTDEAILEKLLALNLERAAEEAKAAKVNKPKTSREKHAEERI